MNNKIIALLALIVAANLFASDTDLFKVDIGHIKNEPLAAWDHGFDGVVTNKTDAPIHVVQWVDSRSEGNWGYDCGVLQPGATCSTKSGDSLGSTKASEHQFAFTKPWSGLDVIYKGKKYYHHYGSGDTGLFMEIHQDGDGIKLTGGRWPQDSAQNTWGWTSVETP